MDQNNSGWEPVPDNQAASSAPPPQSQQSGGWEAVPDNETQQAAPQDGGHWYSPSNLEDVGKGFLKGAQSTVVGLDDMANKVGNDIHPGLGDFLTTPMVGEHARQPGQTEAQASQQYRDLEHQRAQTHNIAQNIGYGGETLTEFLLGDEALKGLSQSDKLGTVSKWMKIAEKSPRLIRALKTGADVEKVGAEAGLSPEAIQFIRSNPTLSKYLTIGMNAARAGVTQGVQTTVRSGGDVKKGAEDAALTAGTGAVLGTVAHGAANVLRRGSKAANTVAAMNEVAANAPSGHEIENSLGNTINDAFSKENGTLQNNLNDATSQVGMFGEGAPPQAQITTAAQKAARIGKQAVHDKYQAGLDHLVEMSGDHTIPYEGSPLHQAAQELSNYTPEEAGPLDEAFQVAQPGSPRANALIDRLSNVGQDAGEEDEAPSTSSIIDPTTNKPFETPVEPAEEQAPAELTMQHLVARRQSLAKMIRNLGPNDRADRDIYGRLLTGIDDTIGKLADSVKDGEGDEHYTEDEEVVPADASKGVKGVDLPVLKSAARQHFDQMNSDYKNGIRPFQNRDVKNVLKGNLNDVAKSIMGGQTSVQDIADVKQALGPENFQAVSRASLQNIVQSFMDQGGELDYKKLFSKINKMDPNVRTAMFGDEGKALSAALKTANDSANGLTEIGKQVNDLLGNGNIDSLIKDPSRLKDISNLVGPDGMKTLGRSIMENQIQKASTVLDPKTGKIVPSNFDPDKVLDWWMSMKDSPEVRDSLFTVDKDTANHYNDMMKDLAQASSVKKLVKYGVLPLTMGTAGVVHGPGAALFGALAGLGTEAGFGRARDILDSIANSPRTWKVLSFGGKSADKLSKALPQPIRNAGTAAVYKGVQNALSGNNQ